IIDNHIPIGLLKLTYAQKHSTSRIMDVIVAIDSPVAAGLGAAATAIAMNSKPLGIPGELVRIHYAILHGEVNKVQGRVGVADRLAAIREKRLAPCWSDDLIM